MAEITLYLIGLFGPSAVVLLMGVVADYVSTPTLKMKVANLIRGKDISAHRRNISEILTVFLEGFLHRIYDRRTLSIRFFVRSCLVSLMIFALAVGFQAIYRPLGITQFRYVADGVTFSAISLTVLMLFNFILDYISNAITIALLRMAAASGRITDTVFICLADVTTTVTLFTLLFPAGVVASMIVGEALKGQVPVKIEVSEGSAVLKQFNETLSESNPSHEFLVISTSQVDSTATPFSPAASSVEVGLVPKDRDSSEVLTDYLAIIKASGQDIIIERQVGKEATVRIGYRTPIKVSTLWVLYQGAYREANVTREAFWGVVRLDTVVLQVSRVYGLAAGVREGQNAIATCRNGEIKIESGDSVGCDYTLQVSEYYPSDPLLRVAHVVAGPHVVPVSPFFFTSFASSLLYYSALVATLIGVFLARIARFMFATPYLENTSRPFLLLSIFLFPLFLVGKMLLALL